VASIAALDHNRAAMEIGEATAGPGRASSGPASLTSGESVEIEIRWIDWRRNALAGWGYELSTGTTELSGTIPGNGITRVTIPASLRRIPFRVFATRSRGLEQLLAAGCCEEELRGVLTVDTLELPSSAVGPQQRLRNLGYYDGPIDEDLVTESSPDAHWLSLCVRRYQHDENMSETGEIDPNTEAALAAAHDNSAS
jgi:hypothetical protein